MTTAPHMHGWDYARTVASSKSPPMIVYTDTKPYAFEIAQDVIVIKPDSPFKGMTGIVTSRRSGKPNKYVVRIEGVNAPIPLYPFTESELQALRFLPIPLWRPKDRIMVAGHIYSADDPVALRVAAHAARQAKKRVATAAVIELPVQSKSTREAIAHEKFVAFQASLSQPRHTRAELYARLAARQALWHKQKAGA